jgi:hypothetical protein
MGMLSTLGTAAGAYFGGKEGAAIGGMIGSGLEGGPDTSGYDAYGNYARQAADAAKFKPYSLTTGYGKSFFDTEKQTAGYELDPRLAAFRDQLYGTAAKNLAALGSTNPEAEAQKYVDQQMGLLAPTRQAEDVANRMKALGTGRIGLGVSSGYVGGDGQGLVNPDDFATRLARERANAEIAAAGTQYGQGMIDKLTSRATGALTAGTGIEELGMKPLTIGADLGKASSLAGAYQGQGLLAAGNAALGANLAQNNYWNQAQQGMFGMFGNKQQPTTSIMPYGMNIGTAFNYGTNPWSQQTSMLAAQEAGM